MAGVVWKVKPRQAWSAGKRRYISDLQRAIYHMLQYYEVRLETDAKTYARWTDRTGNARQTLTSRAEELPNRVVLYLRYGVEYGKPLEYGYGGRYAIIGPTLDSYKPQILRGLEELLR